MTWGHEMNEDAFFEQSREQSIVKTTIVEKYFEAWAGIISAVQNHHRPSQDNRIGYVDLFAGPGCFEDGSFSTPLRVLQKAIGNPLFAERLVTIFNDRNANHISKLKQCICTLPGIARMRHQPEVWNEEVGERIAQLFSQKKKIPILAFIDPCGYKGLTLKLVNAFLSDWGCDCIFFFNYNRINAGLDNHLVRDHMDALFGPLIAARLRVELEPMTPHERESTIVDALATALKEPGNRYVLPFCFKNEAGSRTSHHLILVTKHFKGYEVMKDIMAASSSSTEQGVPTFTYCPATGSSQLLLFELNRPLDELREMLLREFAGRTLAMRQIYREHSVGRPFIKRNYKEVLASLERERIVITSGRKSNRGFGDDILVSFPERKA